VLNFKEFSSLYEPEPIVEETIREQYVEEQYDVLLEKLITFGGRAYPKFGNVVIMAGGAGSGKGFVKDKLVGLEGFTFDVDELKKLASRTLKIVKRVKDELGVDLEQLGTQLRDPDKVSKLHEIIGDALNLDDRRLQAFYASVLSADPERKPNIIFDVTLKDLRKLEKLTRQASSLGYDKKNIHIVWVVNDIEVALDQNASRDRVVRADILVNTHRGAAAKLADGINMGKSLDTYMDGDIVFAFNKIKVDSELKKSGRGGDYIKDANYFYVKRQGKPPIPQEKLGRDLKNKIASYVPSGVNWAD
jgi:DNA-binding Lrp family transcriptional regulator